VPEPEFIEEPSERPDPALDDERRCYTACFTNRHQQLHAITGVRADEPAHRRHPRHRPGRGWFNSV
jgi:hypothetical protein